MISLIISLTALALSITVTVIYERTRRRQKARIRQLENERAARELGEKMRRAFMATLAAQAGTNLVEPVRVEDIKYGDKVCWHPHDMSDHQHYVAGYDGDPGPSTDGVHARPITPKGL
ncbi:hypothetical protein [Brevibacterium sediminis]